MESRWVRRALLLLALAVGVLAVLAAPLGSIGDAVRTGLIVGIVVAVIAIGWTMRTPPGDHDPGRRRLLGQAAAAGGILLALGGAVAGRALKRALLPDPGPIQTKMAHDLGSEYMELVQRAFHPDRSGDIQLVLAPGNSSNYESESLQLRHRDPNTSHASVWMYLERVPLVVVAPGIVAPSDSQDRVTLADIAPTIAGLIGFDGFPEDREGRALPLQRLEAPSDASAPPPRVVVTFVIDGGGWNVLQHWPEAWPNLRRLMGEGANFRNAITGSFPAVTACAHATIGTGAFPRTHGITGHNIRTPQGVRKAYGKAGVADPSDILVPTLADLYSESRGNRPWVGELGYQVWHLGMLGHGGRTRGLAEKPVAVYWSEGSDAWTPHNQDLFRLPGEVPGIDLLDAHRAAFTPPSPSPYDPDPEGSKADCCTPPIVQYQGDLIEAAFDSEPIGATDDPSLLFINFKAPDYAGHLYNMADPREETILAEVDAQLGRLVSLLEERFGPGGFALIVTADHGQCPLPDDVGGTRVDPRELGRDIEAAFHGGGSRVVESVVPSEIYLNAQALEDLGVTRGDVAAFLRDYRYRENIGPYIRPDAIETNLLDNPEFAAVFATEFLATLAGSDLSVYGETTYPGADPGIPKTL
ncbi:MAG: alkaline phosphatase family protein [Actinomycetota bacterium]